MSETQKSPSRQPWPNHNWCIGCTPVNCRGCGQEPIERRKAEAPSEEKLIYVLWSDYGDKTGTEIVRAYTSKVRADQDYELAKKDSTRVWHLSCAKEPI